MTWVVGWIDGDEDRFLAMGEDREGLPVYSVVGDVSDPTTLYETRLLFPSCLKMMPYADPVIDLAEISETEAEALEAKIATIERQQGLD